MDGQAELVGPEGRVLPVEESQLFETLEQPGVDQSALAAGIEKILRARDGARGAMESESRGHRDDLVDGDRCGEDTLFGGRLASRVRAGCRLRATATLCDVAESDTPVPTLEEIAAARRRLENLVVETPVWRWRGREVLERTSPRTDIFLKLELFQHAGTFKPRGALMNMLDLGADELNRGVTAVSAGNHAMAVAYAARALDTTAKVVMPESANPARVEGCRAYGAEVVLVPDVHQAFDEVRRIEREEGRTFVHPFEGERTVLGTATVGWELARQVSDLDAVIVPIGGGGLCAGVATAIKLAQPRCRVYGVEPEGADTMHRSFAAGEPVAIDEVRTIADSLAAPHAAPISFGLCYRFVDDLTLITDEQMRQAMGLLFRDAKLAVEPAGGAATAAMLGPLYERIVDKRVGIIVCGANIDLETYLRYLRST